ncbi:hypothetical protein [Micromonospora mirobrigensis]|uniref:Serpin (Serine protease inhibitor) n=1 Tax=Micromonospora mirobrigensis TaxID=262898 RepID=A0A1C4YV08_9ACTN|nr:hypothetical protein [Micromonospora mirobrigensis]SCF24510.1 hypothetical protein GA0070564_104412 [Micromonospora mirobrigensis]
MTQTPHAALARYADRLHRAVGDRHHVASPLGAWLLLALGAGAATGPDRDELTDLLGADPATAARLAAALLDDPHPLVAAATAAWHRPGYDTAGWTDWRATLPEATGTGPLPGQDELDAWAREHTLGLIGRFPLPVGPDVLFALAGAVATRISWEQPFEVVGADALGADSDWSRRLTRVLRSPRHGHRAWIVATGRAGDVAVHAADARDADGAGLTVVSVAAAPGVSARDVLAVAHELAPAVLDGDGPAGRRSLFELPLGDTPLWRLREETVRTNAPGGREERHVATLPCWSASDEHDLTAAGLGFTTVGRALAALVDAPGADVAARQAAVARYSRYGFEAAAVTGLMGLVSLPPEGVARTAELRFGHPYAVVAVATDRRGDTPGPWHGLPVFSAWVAEPAELPEAEADQPR